MTYEFQSNIFRKLISENSVQNFWTDKFSEINFRKKIGNFVFQNFRIRKLISENPEFQNFRIRKLISEKKVCADERGFGCHTLDVAEIMAL